MTISDKQNCIKAAFEILKKSNTQSFPIKISPIMHYFQDQYGVSFVKYSVLARENNTSVAGIGLVYNSTDAALRYNPQTGETCIVYNDEHPRARQQWSIAHELAHFFFKHHLIKYNAEKAGLSLSKDTQAKQESEANFFPRILMAPIDVVLYFMGGYQAYKEYEVFTLLRSMFHLSQDASYYYAISLLGNGKTLRFLTNPEIANYFEPYCHQIMKEFDSAVFRALTRRYEEEYFRTRAAMNQKASGIYRPRYMESSNEIIRRVLPFPNDNWA